MAITHQFRELNANVVVETITANRTLTVDDSSKLFLIGTDALIITLPATVKGLEFTFINTGANANNDIRLSPAVADGISGVVTLAASTVVLTGVVNKDVINTKASTIRGNSIKIVGTGVTGVNAYLLTASTGIWAAEA